MAEQIQLVADKEYSATLTGTQWATVTELIETGRYAVVKPIIESLSSQFSGGDIANNIAKGENKEFKAPTND